MKPDIVILVTGFLSFDDLVQHGGVPADAFAQKPFSKTKISNLIMDMIEKKMTPVELCE